MRMLKLQQEGAVLGVVVLALQVFLLGLRAVLEEFEPRRRVVHVSANDIEYDVWSVKLEVEVE